MLECVDDVLDSTGWQSAEAVDADRARTARLNRLAKVIAQLADARDIDSLIDTIVQHTAPAVEATVATLSVLDGDTLMLALVGISGGQADTPRRWSSYPLSADLPACEAVRNRSPIVVSGRDAIERRYPALKGQVPDERSLICLPLIAGGEPVAVIGLLFGGLWSPEPAEVEFLQTFAQICAQAFQRVRALTAARDASAKLAFLAEASAELASSLDYRATLARLARLAVPILADWCAVDIVEDGTVRTLAVAHVDPAKVALARELQQRYPADPDAATGAAQVIRTGVSELTQTITDEMLVAGTRDGEHLRLARELNLRSALVVPLNARGRTVGAITLVQAESGRRYDGHDVMLAEDLARRAAVAIDNAQLHGQTREISLRLQRAVLPESLPEIAGWEIVAHYEPAGTTELGGDFYDVVELPDGSVAAFVGDVMGHGLTAAAAMAHIRAATRAYVATDPDPGVVVAKLDNMFALYGTTDLVTIACVLLDPHRDTLSVVVAGHLAPALVHADGKLELVHGRPSPPIGMPTGPRQVLHRPLLVGDAVLLYTDGLIERRDEIIDKGLRRLRTRARTLVSQPLATSLPALVAAVHDPRREDDVTALAIGRRLSTPPS